MKTSRFLAVCAGVAAFVAAPLAFATDYTMSSLSAPSNLAADVIGAGSSGAQFSLAAVGGMIGAIVILGVVGWVLVMLSSLLRAGLHIGRR